MNNGGVREVIEVDIEDYTTHAHRSVGTTIHYVS